MAPTLATPDRLDFDLPAELEAHVPPEARGLARDDVRLMVAHKRHLQLEHVRFADLPDVLPAGSLLVLNTSGTLPAALPALRAGGEPVELHLSTRYPDAVDEVWAVELRGPLDKGAARVTDERIGDLLFLPEGGSALILRAYANTEGQAVAGSRLWLARLRLPEPLLPYLTKFGSPIHYSHIHGRWPIEAFQTIYTETPGSAEMPSAGRPISPRVLDALEARGIQVAKVLLHTGVSSQEADEVPFSEYFSVSDETAGKVNRAKEAGRPIVAVGTTVVLALESAYDGVAVRARRGWTDLVVTPRAGVHVVDGLITGWHEPRASHLMMLEAIAGRPLLEVSYAEAIRTGYLWHEFGDSQLILP